MTGFVADDAEVSFDFSVLAFSRCKFAVFAFISKFSRCKFDAFAFISKFPLLSVLLRSTGSLCAIVEGVDDCVFAGVEGCVFCSTCPAVCSTFMIFKSGVHTPISLAGPSVCLGEQFSVFQLPASLQSMPDLLPSCPHYLTVTR